MMRCCTMAKEKRVGKIEYMSTPEETGRTAPKGQEREWVDRLFVIKENRLKDDNQ